MNTARYRKKNVTDIQRKEMSVLEEKGYNDSIMLIKHCWIKELSWLGVHFPSIKDKVSVS